MVHFLPEGTRTVERLGHQDVNEVALALPYPDDRIGCPL